MPKIRLLDKHVAELIAAGEVVERPSSVIKELVENAIDANSTVITVEIRGGGNSFMRVTDNGVGISKEDVPTAFLRHATSKVIDENDLSAIATLGFRGEALASISAVAKVELLTKPKEQSIGVRYTVSGGEYATLEDAGCPDGTTIIIRDLFFNTPARMKFLKKDVTEGNAISGILDKIALSHPEISFRFIRDGKEQLHTPGDSKLFSAIYAVFGKEFSSHLLPVQYELQSVKVNGFISTPTTSRPNRSMQNFFINGRFIKSRTAAAALDEACKGSIMIGKFAACILNLEMSFEAVDVNVHPAKLEVRFVNERPVFDSVYHAVKSALAKDDSKKIMEFKKPLPLPDAPVEKAEQTVLHTETFSIPSAVKSDNFTTREPSFFNPSISSLHDSGNNGNFEKPPIPRSLDLLLDSSDEKKHNEVINVPQPQEEIINQNFVQENVRQFEEMRKPEVVTRYIGEVFDTYIILQYGPSSIMLIDKHAAHERILYEKLKKQSGESAEQLLLQPVTVTLDKEAYTQVLSHTDTLQQVGFGIEDFGPGLILVRSAPLFLDGTDVGSALDEIAGYLTSHKNDLTTEHLDWLYANISCRAAIKGGNKSTNEELIALVKQLEENPEIKYCPHGRPISMLIKRYDIEKQFGR
ncbi:DNA mismatch repair endonuclease MutL [Scatolibacter rhodanostii]|uniref:DNA mismatch repair endonuclease MutL n=1 Tax=Scatolibacter rhodanostii TaxID=2014781 RepID=UPI000C07BF8C|nr:DNA mismatch repair endonuclease MutL [Scatolibacter rhodanostii]